MVYMPMLICCMLLYLYKFTPWHKKYLYIQMNYYVNRTTF